MALLPEVIRDRKLLERGRDDKAARDAEAISRAARFVEGIRLAALAMNEVGGAPAFSANIDPSVGNLILHPRTPVEERRIHFTRAENSFEPQDGTVRIVAEPIGLRQIRLARIEEDGQLILEGRTTSQNCGVQESVEFNPAEHDLAMHVYKK